MTVASTQQSPNGCLLRFIGVFSCIYCICAQASCATSATPQVAARESPEQAGPSVIRPGPSIEVDLAAWGINSLSELGHARIGVLGETTVISLDPVPEVRPPMLVIYDLGRARAADDLRALARDVKSAPPHLVDGAVLVAPLRGENQNVLGGFFNGFARAPSRVSVEIEGLTSPTCPPTRTCAALVLRPERFDPVDALAATRSGAGVEGGETPCPIGLEPGRAKRPTFAERRRGMSHHASVTALAPTPSLAFRFVRESGTFAGFWIHLFDFSRQQKDRVYLDARGVEWLTFEVRSDGPEVVPLRLQIADATLEARQDSAPLDDLGAFLAAGQVTPHWQRAWVPLALLVRHPGLARQALAGLVFAVDPDSRSTRKGAVFFRNIAFTRVQGQLASALTEVGPVFSAKPSPAKPSPAQPTSAEPTPLNGQKAGPESGDQGLATRTPGARLAFWLWQTRTILASDTEMARLEAFVAAGRYTDIFAQVPYHVGGANAETVPPSLHHHSRSNGFDEAGLARLTTRLARLGVRVYALDGAPELALTSNHGQVLALMSALADYQQRVPPEARLFGVRLDIEPYLLPTWQGARRETILGEYRALLRKIRPVAHGAGLVVGIDLPFWFDARGEDGQWAAPLDGGPALEPLLAEVDDLGVMDYRTAAFGADGVLAHGAGELAAGDRLGKPVFIGLETVPLPDELLVTLAHRPRSPFDVGGELVIEALPTPPSNGPIPSLPVRLSWVPSESRQADGRYPWLENHAPEDPTAQKPVAQNPSAVRFLAISDSTLVSAAKLTFAQDQPGLDSVHRIMDIARPVLARHSSFAGFVLHAYETLVIRQMEASAQDHGPSTPALNR